jgi:predicted nucleic acid-binding Zn ribbon protein
MPRIKRKICLGCGQPFTGRSDARTCSAKCRKRFQRAKVIYRGVLMHEDHQSALAYSSFDYGQTSYRNGAANYRKADDAKR